MSIPRLAIAGAAVLALAGCTALPSGSLDAAANRLRNNADPAVGGLNTLTWDLPSGEPTTLDYMQAGDTSSDTMVSNLCDDVLRMNADYSESPGLAESWSRPNPTTLILNIRPGVKFWDGHALTAEDVAYSLNRNTAATAVASGYFVNVAGITASGPLTVTVKFSQPDELFLKELATVAGTVVEKAYAQKAGNKFGTPTGGVMCSGPFKLDKWTPGTGITMSRNSDYWDPAYRAKAASVTVDFITDTTALTQALSSGTIDGAYEVPTAALDTLQNTASGKVYLGRSLEMLQIAPMTNTGPAAIPDIRKALSIAVDRKELAAVVYRGAATASTTVLPSTSWDPAAESVYASAAAALAKNPGTLATAKALVAEHKSALRPITLAIQAGNQDQIDTATLVQQAAESIGLTIEIKQLSALADSSMYYDPTYRKGVDLALTEAFLDIPDALDWIPLAVLPGSLFNFIGFDDPTVASNLAEAQQTFDPTRRAELITAAQARWEAQSITVPLLNLDEVTYMNNKITGGATSFAHIFMPSLAQVGSR